jgi:hypothetical protein
VEAFDEFALGSGTEASAMACVRIRVDEDAHIGVAFGNDTTSAALQAVLSALGRSPARVIESSVRPAALAEERALGLNAGLHTR